MEKTNKIVSGIADGCVAFGSLCAFFGGFHAAMGEMIIIFSVILFGNVLMFGTKKWKFNDLKSVLGSIFTLSLGILALLTVITQVFWFMYAWIGLAIILIWAMIKN